MLLFRLFEMIKIGFFKIEGFFVGFKDRIFVRKSEKQKIEMKKENKYDTTRTVGNLQK